MPPPSLRWLPCLLAAGLAVACVQTEEEEEECSEELSPAYDDGTALAALDFEHEVSATASGSYWAALIGPGVVAADLDRDGFDDLFFPQHTGSERVGRTKCFS